MRQVPSAGRWICETHAARARTTSGSGSGQPWDTVSGRLVPSGSKVSARWREIVHAAPFDRHAVGASDPGAHGLEPFGEHGDERVAAGAGWHQPAQPARESLDEIMHHQGLRHDRTVGQ
jgi:hypothetical protein